MRTLALLLALAPVAARADLVPLRIDAEREGGTATLQLEASEIASATLEPGPDGEPALRVKLDLSRWEDLRRFSADAAGGALVVTVCGEELARPIVTTPIADGLFVLSGLGRQAAHRAAARLTGAASCEGRAP